jgi:hypothetical protein
MYILAVKPRETDATAFFVATNKRAVHAHVKNVLNGANLTLDEAFAWRGNDGSGWCEGSEGAWTHIQGVVGEMARIVI